MRKKKNFIESAVVRLCGSGCVALLYYISLLSNVEHSALICQRYSIGRLQLISMKKSLNCLILKST